MNNLQVKKNKESKLSTIYSLRLNIFQKKSQSKQQLMEKNVYMNNIRTRMAHS